MSRGRPRSFDREAALQKAMFVFWELGYECASMTDLTTAMGIGSPSLYAAFGGKEALFREAVTHYGATFGGMTDRALAEQATAREAVEAMLRDNAESYIRAEHPAGCMIVLAATNYTPGNQGVHDYLAELRRGCQETLRASLRQGVTDGELPSDTDVDGMAAFYITVLNGLSIQARDGAKANELTAVVNGAMAAWSGYDKGVSPK
jgi:AcrR family transcriptional regulator